MKNAFICSVETDEKKRLKNMLINHGFAEILESADLKKGYKMAFEGLTDLLVIDIDAENSDMIPLLESIKKPPVIPVIILGSNFSEELLKVSLKAGVGAFLSKPVREAELFSAIELAAIHIHEIETLREKIESLENAIETRKIVEKAKGVLMAGKKLSEPEAFRKMQKLAMDSRKTLRQVAEAILIAGGNGTM